MENVPSTEINETKLPEKIEENKRKQLDFQDQIFNLVPLSGTIELDEKQKEILFAPVNAEDIEIRPDGLIYLPWMEYVSRLRDAFGVSWAIIPQGNPMVKGNSIMWGFWLIIKGKPAGFAMGEQEHQPNNPKMTYGDALEGSKSNALMRLCKGIGISLELWKPSFIRNWKKENAESYKTTNKYGKEVTLWRKKNGEKHSEPDIEEAEVMPEYNLSKPPQENKPQTQSSKTSDSAGCISKAQVSRFWAIAKATGANNDTIKNWLIEKYHIEHADRIPYKQYEEICKKVKEDLSIPNS